MQHRMTLIAIVTIANNTISSLVYHWDIFAVPLSISGEPDVLGSQQITVFKIEPTEGVLEPNSTKDFSVIFSPVEIMTYRQHAQLVIDKVPSSGM